MREWERLGVHRAAGKTFPRADDKAFLLVPAGAQGPGFLMLQNFRAIMKYNPAEAYAMAIGHLADRLRGGEPFVQPWPRHERVLSRTERYELQQLLAERGFDVGEPDGRLGGRTRNALRQFQASVGQVPDGFASGADPGTPTRAPRMVCRRGRLGRVGLDPYRPSSSCPFFLVYFAD